MGDDLEMASAEFQSMSASVSYSFTRDEEIEEFDVALV